jgi:hypothetical protein
MPGFPARPTRTGFGPKPTNRKTVNNPLKEGGADLFDLVFWQLAGAGLMVPLAWVLVDGATGGIILSDESWDAERAAVPTVTHPVAGTYAVEYASSYLDKDGVAVTTALKACSVHAQTITGHRGEGLLQVNNRICDIRIRDGAGGLDDCTFLAAFYG